MLALGSTACFPQGACKHLGEPLQYLSPSRCMRDLLLRETALPRRHPPSLLPGSRWQLIRDDAAVGGSVSTGRTRNQGAAAGTCSPSTPTAAVCDSTNDCGRKAGSSAVDNRPVSATSSAECAPSRNCRVPYGARRPAVLATDRVDPGPMNSRDSSHSARPRPDPLNDGILVEIALSHQRLREERIVTRLQRMRCAGRDRPWGPGSKVSAPGEFCVRQNWGFGHHHLPVSSGENLEGALRRNRHPRRN